MAHWFEIRDAAIAARERSNDYSTTVYMSTIASAEEVSPSSSLVNPSRSAQNDSFTTSDGAAVTTIFSNSSATAIGNDDDDDVKSSDGGGCCIRSKSQDVVTTTTTPPANIDWTKAVSKCIPWNDGHVPISLLSSQPQQQYLRLYPQYHCPERVAVYCIDNAIPTSLLDALYNYTTTKPSTRTWGTYIPLSHIREYWKQQHNNNNNPVMMTQQPALTTTTDHWTTESSTTATTTTKAANTTRTKASSAAMSDTNKCSHVQGSRTTITPADTNTTTTTRTEEYNLALAASAYFLRHAVLASAAPASSSAIPADMSSTTTTTLVSFPPPQEPLWTWEDCGYNGSISSCDTATATPNSATEASRPSINDEAVTSRQQDASDSSALTSLMTGTGAHGVAVWALASECHSHVPYHIDYAELIRYETGTIVVPVLAGTLQCSRLQSTTTTSNIASPPPRPDAATALEPIVGGDYVVHVGTGKSRHHQTSPYTNSNPHSSTTDDNNQRLNSSSVEDEDDVMYHYRQHGYKSLLSSGDAWTDIASNDMRNARDRESNGNSTTAPNPDPNLATTLLGPDPYWVRIPYQFNRMICQSGHLPHLSTRIASMGRHESSEPVSSCQQHDDDDTTKRVILGFNVFLHDVGPVVEQAPEHSEAFRQRVRRATPKPQSKYDATSSGITLAALATNPRLRKRLIQAKREKDQQDFVQAQNVLTDTICQVLRQQQCVDDTKAAATTTKAMPVRQLLRVVSPSLTTEGTCGARQWPCTTTDVHIHLHRLWKKGIVVCYAHCQQGDHENLEQISPQTTTKLIEEEWLVGLAELRA